MGGAAPHQLVLPHGLRGTLALYPQWLVLLILTLLIVSLVAALVLLWRWWRRRRLNALVQASTLGTNFFLE